MSTRRLSRSCRAGRRHTQDHVAVNTTTRCQQRCVYCFEGDRAGNRHLDSAEVRTLIEDAAQKSPMIIFMGGETTLRTDFVELVAFAKSLGLRVSASTNGLRFADMDFLRKSVEAGLTTIELSFPYPDADVYHAITGCPPAGFSRLLQALDNINALPAEQRPFVEIVTVVSRYNHRRLGAVMELLASRLPDAGLVVFRNVAPVKYEGENKAAAPLSELRAALPPLLSGWKYRFPAALRNFPLCAAPGYEHLDADLAYIRAGVTVRQNFFSQKKMSDMYPDAVLFKRHVFSDICEKCSLRFCCLNRSLFVEMESAPANAPVASDRPAREVLIANGAKSKDADAALKALRSRFLRCVRAAPRVDAPRSRRIVDGPALRRLLDDVDRRLRARIDCRSRFEGDVLHVHLGGKEHRLFLAMRQEYDGPFFAELPSFFVCIRGDAKMSHPETARLRAYVKVLAGKDAELAELLRGWRTHLHEIRPKES